MRQQVKFDGAGRSSVLLTAVAALAACIMAGQLSGVAGGNGPNTALDRSWSTQYAELRLAHRLLGV
ncbi:MAG: hypothetical protein ACYC6N_19995 [Pirellulaceae bacterium]